MKSTPRQKNRARRVLRAREGYFKGFLVANGARRERMRAWVSEALHELRRRFSNYADRILSPVERTNPRP